ncbi:hypothetical protein [Devosia sp. A16]|uniref:hypothetical protein n=1 Tax=Devosia sp. A16 TaxID=1736675 RepID=UPI000AC27160|nr:hypothetical protein [Devosia sp. A16]
MSDAPDPLPPRQYTAGFLAGSFGLTLKQARDILASVGEDRTAAAEQARKKKADRTL